MLENTPLKMQLSANDCDIQTIAPQKNQLYLKARETGVTCSHWLPNLFSDTIHLFSSIAVVLTSELS